MNLEKGQMVVYPGHGVCEVSKIRELEVGGKKKEFVVCTTLFSKLTLMCEAERLEATGVRRITSRARIESLLENAKAIEEPGSTTWNRRYRECSDRIQTGEFESILNVAILLLSVRLTKDLSFGERKMLDKAYDLMAQELTSVSQLGYASAVSFVTKTLEQRVR